MSANSESLSSAVGEALGYIMYDSKSSVERTNVVIRILAVVGGAIALWAYHEGDTSLLHQVGWATTGVTGVSFLLNFHTVYKEYKRKRSTAFSIFSRFIKETVKTGLSPLAAPIAVGAGSVVFGLGSMGFNCWACSYSCGPCGSLDDASTSPATPENAPANKRADRSSMHFAKA